MGSTIGANPDLHYHAREGEKFAGDATLEVVRCFTCGITYAIPESLVASAHRYHGNTSNGWKLCCPLGHVWWYVGETEVERLRRIADEEREIAARERAARDQAEASARGQKAAATRARNQRDRLGRRAAAGVCPCCSRTFTQLRRHMTSQHPEYDPAQGDG